MFLSFVFILWFWQIFGRVERTCGVDEFWQLLITRIPRHTYIHTYIAYTYMYTLDMTVTTTQTNKQTYARIVFINFRFYLICMLARIYLTLFEFSFSTTVKCYCRWLLSVLCFMFDQVLLCGFRVIDLIFISK